MLLEADMAPDHALQKRLVSSGWMLESFQIFDGRTASSRFLSESALQGSLAKQNSEEAKGTWGSWRNNAAVQSQSLLGGGSSLWDSAESFAMIAFDT